MEWSVLINWWILFWIGFSRVFKDIFFKSHEEKTDNCPERIYAKKIEHRITFTIKTGYYLELLAPGTKKLLRSTKSKITKNKLAGNMPNLENTEVMLVHYNFANNDY